MTQIQKLFKKEVTDFFNYYDEFEKIARMRQNTIEFFEILPLFKIFMNKYEYMELE